MNELETYVASLQDQNLGKEEMKAKVKAWKLANEPLLEKEKEDPPSKFKSDGRPKFVLAKTIKGKGVSFLQGHGKWHHKIPNEKEIDLIKKELK